MDHVERSVMDVPAGRCAPSESASEDGRRGTGGAGSGGGRAGETLESLSQEAAAAHAWGVSVGRRARTPFGRHVARGLLALVLAACLGEARGGGSFVGVAKTLGDQRTLRARITSQGEEAQISAIEETGAGSGIQSRGVDPALGVATWNPVEKILYYGSAEDGFSSAYVTPYSIDELQTIVQRSVRGVTDTSFTLTSIQYNRVDSQLYGLVTYSSGEHFMITMEINTQSGQKSPSQVQFDSAVQLQYSHIAPGISGFDAVHQLYFGVGIRGNFAYLIAIFTGFTPSGLVPAYLKWEKVLPGVLTSIEVDAVTGDVYGVLHNASGHFLLHFDSENGGYGGKYTWYDAREEATFYREEPSTQFHEVPEEELAIGLSSFSPPADDTADSNYHAIKLRNRDGGNMTSVLELDLQNYNIGTARGGRVEKNTTLTQRIDNPEGLTLTALQIEYITVPVVLSAVPSTANIKGGSLVTIRGEPFVDTGPSQMICRWKTYPSGKTLFSVSASFVNSSAIVCVTPVLETRERAWVDLSLTAGTVYTLNVVPFTFYETTGRSPLSGSSKGTTIIFIRGLLLQDMATQDIAYTDPEGRKKISTGVVDSASCEFGDIPSTDPLAPFDPLYQLQDKAPNAPQFRSQTCVQVLIGFDIETVCALTCNAPPVPNIKCPSYQGTRCGFFVDECPAATSTTYEARSSCKFLVDAFATIPFGAIFFGDRLQFDGGWFWSGYLSPVILGSRFLDDTSGMMIELATNSNRARFIGGKISAYKLFLNADIVFGQGAFVSFLLPHRMIIYFGNLPTIKEGTFMDVRAYTIASAEPNIYSYLSGSTVADALGNEGMPRPLAKIETSYDSSACRGPVVNAAGSNVGGCRPLSYRWGARVAKCIDVNCLNSVELAPKSQLWLLTAQRTLYNTNSEKVTTSTVFAGGLQLGILGANKIYWVLQTTNWLFRDFIFNPSGHVSCVMPSVDPRCNLCKDLDPRLCPAVSVHSVATSRLHSTPVPDVQLTQPRTEDTEYDDVNLYATIVIPAAQVESLDYCPIAPQLYFKASDSEDIAKAYATISVRWSVEELAMNEVVHDDAYWHSLSDVPDGRLFTSNEISLANIGTDTQGSALSIPARFLRPNHVYRISVTVIAGPGSADPRTAKTNTIIRTRGVSFTPSVTGQTKEEFTGGVVIAPVTITDSDLSVVNVEGTPAGGTELEITALFTPGLDFLDRDTEVMYVWKCRKWLAGSLDYWIMESDIATPSSAGVSDCLFNNFNTSVKVSDANPSGRMGVVNTGPAMSIKGFELTHLTVHEFSLEISVKYPNSLEPVTYPKGFLRLKIVRTDSDDFAFLKTGRNVVVRLKASGMPRKLAPGPLSLTATLDTLTFAEGFARGCQPSPVAPFNPGCRMVFDEVGYGLDLTNKNITTSNIDVGFIGYPGIFAINIDPAMISAGSRFVFRATLFSVRVLANSEVWVERGYQELILDVNSPPRCGRLEVSPASGDAFVTLFSLRALQWEDDPEDLPIRFSFSTLMGDSPDPVYLTDYHEIESYGSILPMTKPVAAAFPCEGAFTSPAEFAAAFPTLGQDVLYTAAGVSLCSMVRVNLAVRDIHGAEDHSFQDVPVTITAKSTSAATVESIFLRAQAAAYQGRNVPAMLATMEHLAQMSTDPVTAAAVNEANRLNSAKKSLPAYQDAVVSTLTTAFAFLGGKLVPTSGIVAAMTGRAVEQAMSALSKVTPEILTKMLALITSSTFRLRPVGASRAIVQSMLQSLSSLVRKLLEPLGILGTSSRRELLTHNDDVTTAFNAVTDSFLSLCITRLGTVAGGTAPELYQAADFDNIFYRVEGAVSSQNVTLTIPAAAGCSEVTIVLTNLDSRTDLFVCAASYHYNPVAYQGVKTGGDVLVGTTQQTAGFAWPLVATSCPSSVEFLTTDGEAIAAPVLSIAISYLLPKDQVRVSVPSTPGYTSLVFRDQMFSAACEEFFTDSTAGRAAPGGWFLGHETTIEDSDDDNFCNATHWDTETYLPAPDVASGRVQCTYRPSVATGSRVPTRLYGVLLEKSDCEGTVDVPSRTTGSWRDGQFAFYTGGASSPRKVCDRCKKCGGNNQCSLSCDNEVSGKEPIDLDLCGVCGGYCTTESECTVAKCTPVYLRYLGNKFPADLDISGDGLTAGKFVFPTTTDVACPGPRPAGAPQGVCTNIKVGALTGRMERYPFHSAVKTCWENSPMIPAGSPDSVCTFESDSLRISDTVPGSFRTITIFAADQAGVVLPDGKAVTPNVFGDRLMRNNVGTGATFELNGTNPLPAISGTYFQLQTAVNLLRFRPLKNWNSKFPPERYRFVHFGFSVSTLAAIVKVEIKPVNDPPILRASATPYQVQEDRATTLDLPSPIVVVDDADDVEGASITVTLAVFVAGSGIRFGKTAAFQRALILQGSVVHVNQQLAIVQYLSPENSNAMFNSPVDYITATVNDHGFGGVAPHNNPYQHSIKVNITQVLQNDPPIAMMQKELIVYQNAGAAFVGAHVVDPDLWQTTDLETNPPLYEATLSVDEGTLTTGVFRINCSNVYFPPIQIGMSAFKYVDEKLNQIDCVVSGCALIKVDGRIGNHKVGFFAFETEPTLNDAAKAYPSLTAIVSVFKLDCYDAHEDRGVAAQTGLAYAKTPCQAGFFDLYLGDCIWARANSFWSYRTYEAGLKKPRVLVGRGYTTPTNREWITVKVDSKLLLEHIEENGGKACFQVDPIGINETQRYSATAPGYVRKSSQEEMVEPKLDFFLGGGVNASAQKANCTIKVMQGSGNGDQKIRFRTDIQAMNRVVEKIRYNIVGGYSNMLSGDYLAVSLAVMDVTPSAILACARAQTLFGSSACSTPNVATTVVKVMPIKISKIEFHMQPYYADRWLRAKSALGATPVYLAFEDCGGRAWLDDCPSKLQIIPGVVSGEFPAGIFTVEVSVKLGTITVPASVRENLRFIKGSGVRDAVVRFEGKTDDVRVALLDMVYHTRLDSHVQYKNLYSTEHPGDANIACARPCFFNNIGPIAFLGADENTGCATGCSKAIGKRVNQNAVSEAAEGGIFLDDVVITFSDNGNTGVGMEKYTTLQMYNIFTVAVNDMPCIIFKGRISSGCRGACANPGLPNNCYTTGEDRSNLPFDLNNPFETSMFEGQSEPILLGGMVAKIVDEYESSRFECRKLLSAALGNRGEGVTDPSWVEECPRLNVRMSANNGFLALNSREFIEIYLGSESTFFSPIAFLGYAIDVNSAMRMIRYQVNPNNPYFNSNLGTEVVTLSVTDQGFSGSDSTGEFDGTGAESKLTFIVSIEPVNNLPIITVPRASDPIQVNENGEAQLSRASLSPGLDVTDVDSDECNGKITLVLEVPYGRLYFAKVKTLTITPISDASVDAIEFFATPSCTESMCSAMPNEDFCSNAYPCEWLSLAEPMRCECRKVSPGGRCSVLKLSGPQTHIQAALKAVVYAPPPNTNYLSHPTSELLNIKVSDKVDPENAVADDFSCGRTLGERITWVEATAQIQTTPISQPAVMTNAPIVINKGFESPPVCEGLFRCADTMVPNTCGGISSMPPVSSFGWFVVSGHAGVSFSGWVGDVGSAGGAQHLYLAPSGDTPAAVNQTVSGLVIGGEYKIAVRVGSRKTGNGGSQFSVFLIEGEAGRDFTWADFLPTILVAQAVSRAGLDYASFVSTTFVSHRDHYPLVLKAEVTSLQRPSEGRIVFVDEVDYQFVAYNMVENTDLFLAGFRVVDPDYIAPVLAQMLRNGVPFIFNVVLQATYGQFELAADECTVAPPDSYGNPAQLTTSTARSQWGLKCWNLLGERSISEWANTTIFRPDCPPNWAGKGTEQEPCVNIPVVAVNVSWSGFVPNEQLLGQTHMPSKRIEMTGNAEGIEKGVREMFRYIPPPNFNTNNVGKENIKVSVSDLGNFNGAGVANIREGTIQIRVQAVNNPPNITMKTIGAQIHEDTSVLITGLQVTDPDLDEITCGSEPCYTSAGLMLLSAEVNNGSISLFEGTKSVDMIGLLANAFKDFVPAGEIEPLLCIWKLSCSPQKGYMTLATYTKETLCTDLPARCKKVQLYCGMADVVTRDVVLDNCLTLLNARSLLNEMQKVQENVMVANEIALQETLFNTVLTVGMVTVETNGQAIMAGTAVMLNRALKDEVLQFTPDLDFNGDSPVRLTINDLTNVGMEYPCDAPDDVPPALMFEYCRKARPIVALITEVEWPVTVLPLNDPPEIYMYDAFGINRLPALQTIEAVQNQTMFIPKLEIVDADLQETSGCLMNVEINARTGGVITFNATKAPALEYSGNPTQTQILAIGSIQDINVMMQNIEYRSDAQYTGIETLLVNVYDNGCTGETAEKEFAYEAFILEVSVTRPKTCGYTSCDGCISQTEEACGWCPSSCEGVGKCREAVSINGLPLYGNCPEMNGLRWNMCKPEGDQSYTIGLIGAPIMFIALVAFYFTFQWARRMHGTLPLYLSKAGIALDRVVRSFAFSPQAGSKITQIVFMGCICVLAGVLPGVIQTLSVVPKLERTLGEALTFTLVTDNCNIRFVGVDVAVTQPAFIRSYITANETLEGVFVNVDFCQEDQFVRISNNRPELERSTGYECEIDIEIPIEPDHSIPIMIIENKGSKATTVKSLSQTQRINFGPNSLTISGSNVVVELYNLVCRRFFVPSLEMGGVMLSNATFTTMHVDVGQADIFISVSSERSMRVPFALTYRQPENSVCFVSGNDGGKDFEVVNRCQKNCLNVTVNTTTMDLVDGTLTETVRESFEERCTFACASTSTARIVPFKRDPQPGLSDFEVFLQSASGQIYFLGVPEQRTPPGSGRLPLDSLYVYDGIQENRVLDIQPNAKALLDVSFHPGGAARPKADWYNLALEGPSSPPGQFVWVSDVRYLVMERNLLHVLSLGLLVPNEATSNLPLAPALCPSFDVGYDPETKFERAPSLEEPAFAARRLLQTDNVGIGNSDYLVSFFSLLFASVKGLEMPPTSFIAYFPPGAPPIVFQLDTNSGEFLPVQISLSEKPLIVALMVMGILIPGCFSLLVVYTCGWKARLAIKLFRERKYQTEVAARMLLDASRTTTLTLEQEMAREVELSELQRTFYIKTNFFYFLDAQIGEPDATPNIYNLLTYSGFHFAFVSISCVPAFVFGLQWTAGRDMYVCPRANDAVACVAAFPIPALAVYIVVAVYLVITLLELYSFYANLPWNFARKQLRRAWYTAQGVVTFLSMFYITVVITWIFIGLLFRPLEFVPYILGFIGAILVVSRYAYRSNRVQQRIGRVIAQRGEMVVAQLMGHLPRDIIVSMIDAQTQKVLRIKKMTLISLMNNVASMVGVLSAVLIFLFIAFMAFTDAEELLPVKSAIVLVVLIAVDGVANARKDREILAQDINSVSREIVDEAMRRIHFVVRQIEMGQLLLKEFDDEHALLEEEEEEAEIPDYQGWGAKPVRKPPKASLYQVHADAARQLIHGDEEGKGKLRHISLDEESMANATTGYMPRAMEPRETTTLPFSQADAGPEVALLLDGNDASSEQQIHAALARALGVAPDRLMVTAH